MALGGKLADLMRSSRFIRRTTSMTPSRILTGVPPFLSPFAISTTVTE